MAATNEIRETTPKILHESAVVSRRLEQAYLSAAEKGVVKTLQKLLARRNEFNVNCVGSNRKSAIDLAIENEHLDVLSLLLENGVQDPNGLLRAVDVNFTKAVEMICQHAYKANQFEVIESKDSTGEFHPDITPLILAAHTNNYDIIKILLDYGANIKAPGSDSYVTEKHTLQRSLGTLNIYRAISSESYISLTSEDPIQTAFELGTKLRKMSATDYEFRQEYQELSEKCEQYAADLLGQTRDTKELKTILHHDLSKWKHADRISKGFPYKILASIDHKQKRFVAHPNCQQYLIEKWYEGLGSWRDYSLFKQLFISLLIMIASPIISIAYIIFPKGFIGRFARTPYVKFLMTFASTLVFLGILISSTSDALGSDDEYARTLLFTPQNFVLFLFVMGDTWTEIKELWSQGLSDYREDKWNWLSYFNITLYWTVFGLMFVTYFDKNIFTEQAVVRSRSTREVFCNGNGTVWNGLCAPPPECTNGYQYDSDKGVCCLEDAEKYHDCYYRGCEGGLIFDGLNCIYFDNENSSWLVDTTVDSCNDGFAYDSDIGMCRPLPSCFGGYLLSVEHFSCCLPNQNGTGCEVMPCPFREWFEYSGEDCYWWDGTQLWIWNNYLTLEKFKEFTSNNTLPEIKRLLDEAAAKAVADSEKITLNAMYSIQETIIQNLTDPIQALSSDDSPIASIVAKSVVESVASLFQDISAQNSAVESVSVSANLEAAGNNNLNERDYWSESDIRLVAEMIFSITNVISFLRLLRLIVMNENVGPLQISLGRMGGDIIKFLVIFSLVWIAFALGLTQLFSKEQALFCQTEPEKCDRNYYSDLYQSLLTLFWSIFGLVDLDSMLKSRHNISFVAGYYMFGFFLFFAAVVLLNALIAMMSNTYTRVEEDSDTEWKFARANMWMSYLSDGTTLPPPFNMIPTPKTVVYFFMALFFFFCRCFASKRSKKNMNKIMKGEKEYQEVLQQLVMRYTMDKKNNNREDDSSGANSREIFDIKQAVSAFRYEMLEMIEALEQRTNQQLQNSSAIENKIVDVDLSVKNSNVQMNGMVDKMLRITRENGWKIKPKKASRSVVKPPTIRQSHEELSATLDAKTTTQVSLENDTETTARVEPHSSSVDSAPSSPATPLVESPKEQQESKNKNKKNLKELFGLGKKKKKSSSSKLAASYDLVSSALSLAESDDGPGTETETGSSTSGLLSTDSELSDATSSLMSSMEVMKDILPSIPAEVINEEIDKIRVEIQVENNNSRAPTDNLSSETEKDSLSKETEKKVISAPPRDEESPNPSDVAVFQKSNSSKGIRAYRSKGRDQINPAATSVSPSPSPPPNIKDRIKMFNMPT